MTPERPGSASFTYKSPERRGAATQAEIKQAQERLSEQSQAPNATQVGPGPSTPIPAPRSSDAMQPSSTPQGAQLASSGSTLQMPVSRESGGLGRSKSSSNMQGFTEPRDSLGRRARERVNSAVGSVTALLARSSSPRPGSENRVNENDQNATGSVSPTFAISRASDRAVVPDPQSLDEHLESPVMRAAMFAFTKNAHTDEQMLFFRECDDLKTYLDIPDPVMVKVVLTNIQSMAEVNDVNISDALNKELLAALKTALDDGGRGNAIQALRAVIKEVKSAGLFGGVSNAAVFGRFLVSAERREALPKWRAEPLSARAPWPADLPDSNPPVATPSATAAATAMPIPSIASPSAVNTTPVVVGASPRAVDSSSGASDLPDAVAQDGDFGSPLGFRTCCQEYREAVETHEKEELLSRVLLHVMENLSQKEREPSTPAIVNVAHVRAVMQQKPLRPAAFFEMDKVIKAFETNDKKFDTAASAQALLELDIADSFVLALERSGLGGQSTRVF